MNYNKVIKDLKEKNQYWMKLESEIKESLNDALNKLIQLIYFGTGPEVPSGPE